MQATSKKSGLFYGWVIVGLGCLVMAVIMGIIYNCFSQFIKPVGDALGFSRQQMSICQTLISLSQVIIALSWGKIQKRVDLKKFMLAIAVIGPVNFALYSTANSLWQLYLHSAISGVAMASLCVLPFSMILANWFNDKRGLATGICFMGSGLGGMIFNPVAVALIEGFGWRMAFMGLGAAMAIIAIPCILLVRVRPEDMGLEPLGGYVTKSADTGEEWGYTLAEAKKMPKLWLLASCALLVNSGLSALVQVLAPHLTDNGYTTTFAATMVSVAMAVMAIGKILLGQLYDKLGVRRATFLSLTCAFLGYMGIIFCTVKPMLGCIILGIGLGCAFGTVANPIIVQTIFGKKEYAAIIGIFTAMGNLGGVLAPTVNGTAYDMFGSYNPAFYLWATFVVLAVVNYAIQLPKGSRK